MGTRHSDTRAVVYARISDDAESTGLGVERQLKECRELAERRGYVVVDEYVDNDVSAYRDVTRPAFERLMSDAVAGLLDVVLVFAADRLYRRVSDLGRITSELATVVRIEQVLGAELDLGTADGLMRAQIGSVFSEYESRRKAERLESRSRQRAEQGRLTSGGLRPYGWAWRVPCPGGVDCRHARPCEVGQTRRAARYSRAGLVIHPEEAAYVEESYRRLDSGSSVRSVAAWLRSEGQTGPSGAEFTSNNLRSFITSARHAGLVTYRGQLVSEAADSQRIIDAATWHRVQQRLTDPARRTRPGGVITTLFGGLIVDACGSKMSASTKDQTSRASGEVKRVPVYKCRDCGSTRRRAAVDPHVRAAVAAYLDRYAGAWSEAATHISDPAATAAAREADELRGRLASLAVLFAEGTLAPQAFAAADGEVRTRLAEAERRAARVQGRTATLALGLRKPGERWLALCDSDTDAARAVLLEVVATVRLQPPAMPGRPSEHDVQIIWR